MLNLFKNVLKLQNGKKLNLFCRHIGVSTLYNSDENDESKKGMRLPDVNDKKDFWKTLTYEYNHEVFDMIPRQVDALIIGGGIIGWSVAYHLRHLTNLSVVVIERDPTHTRSASVLGLGAIRQQFSEPENIQMSLFGADFIRNAKEYLSILDLDPPDIQFHHHGFLTLASDKGFEQLKKCYEVQKQLGAKVELLRKNDLTAVWPWLNVEDVGGGIHGYENEGWFDSWELLCALKRKACSLGAQEVNGEMIGVEFYVGKRGDEVRKIPRNVVVRNIDGNVQPIESAKTIICAGSWSASIGNMFGIGNIDSDAGPIPIPVEPRLQHIYVVGPANKSSSNWSEDQQTPSIDCPFIVDYDGLNIRRDRLGGSFLVYQDSHLINPPDKQQKAIAIPAQSQESGLDIDFQYFDRHIRPQLSRRIPSMQNYTLQYGWTSPYDYNYIDQNLIIGQHPSVGQVMMACGSTGHGIEHSLAIGNAIYELIMYSDYQTIDLKNFSFSRFYENELIFEKEIF